MVKKKPKKKIKNPKVKKVVDDLKGQDPQSHFWADRKPIQRLGQGVHNGLFYYGVTTTRGEVGIVTSDKGFYVRRKEIEQENGKDKAVIHNDIKEKFELNYQHSFDDESVEYPWKQRSILQYLSGEYIKPNLKELVENIAGVNASYVSHLEPETHKYIACYTVGTYCYTLFDSMGRLFYNAERGSGKSKQSRVNKLTMFNSMWITKGTESSTVRNLEATCGTPIIDNYDKIHEETKKAVDHLFETGLYPDAKYRLTDKNTHKTTAFRTYSPLVLNNILGLDENTIDKAMEIKMLKTTDKIRNKHPDTKEKTWENIRDNCRLWVLDNWGKVTETYKSLDGEVFDGRFFDVIKGPLTIAKIAGDDIYNGVLEFCKRKEQESKAITLDSDWAFTFFTQLELYCKGKSQWVQPREVACMIVEDIEPIRSWTDKEGNDHMDMTDYKKKLTKVSRWAGKKLRNTAGFKKTKISRGNTLFWVDFEHLKKYNQLMGYKLDSEDNDLPENDKLHHHTPPTPPSSPTPPTSPQKVVTSGDVGDVGDVGGQGVESSENLKEFIKKEAKNDKS